LQVRQPQQIKGGMPFMANDSGSLSHTNNALKAWCIPPAQPVVLIAGKTEIPAGI